MKNIETSVGVIPMQEKKEEVDKKDIEMNKKNNPNNNMIKII